MPSIITIDGPAASGKSTLGKILADELGYLFFDTGAMYRAVTLAALLAQVPYSDKPAVTSLAESIEIDIGPVSIPDGRSCDILLDGRDVTWEIRLPEVDRNVSLVSTYPGVRKALTRQQRRIAMRGRVVMVGRDIGTVVIPEAELKIFLVASAEERARRRYLEQVPRGVLQSYDEILSAMRRRDQIDSTRRLAPLKPAADAVILDTDQMEIQQVLTEVRLLLHAMQEKD
jgi:cytidylate kinase